MQPRAGVSQLQVISQRLNKIVLHLNVSVASSKVSRHDVYPDHHIVIRSGLECVGPIRLVRGFPFNYRVFLQGSNKVRSATDRRESVGYRAAGMIV